MTILHKDEYQLLNGQYVSIQQRENDGVWEVACWNKDDTNHWYKEYPKLLEIDARNEFEKWKPS